MQKKVKLMIMKKFTILTTFLLFLSTVNAFADIAFVANVDGNWDLFTVDDEGRNPVQLTDTPYDEKDPAWSLDRKKIVYATSDGYLNLIDTVTGERHQIAIDEQNTPKVCPCFSPDGKQMAYAQFRPPGSGDDTDLMTFNFETNATSRVLDQYALQMWPDWSPDGRRLVYTSAHCSGDCGRMIQELWIADPEGGWARQLLLTNSFCQQPAWSPDGRQVAFSSDKSGNFDIWVISLEDWRLEQITKDKSLDVSPAWSSDGKRLAFVSTKSGKIEIWIKELRNGELRRLRPFGERDVECKDVAW